MAKTERKISSKTLDKYKLLVDEYLVNGFNGSKAYKKFYPRSKRPDDSFSKLQRIPEVYEYLKSKQLKVSEKLDITFERQLKELEDIKSKTNDLAEYNTSISAIKEQNKLLGFYLEDNKQRNLHVVETREERDAYLKSVEDKIKANVDV